MITKILEFIFGLRGKPEGQLTLMGVGPSGAAGGGGGGGNHILTEAGDFLTTELGDQLITET